MLTVTGVAAGSTSVVVKDNGSPAKTVTIPITVTTSGGGGGGFTTAGTVSFSSNKGNFTASGIYNGDATTGSGAGAMTMSSGGSYIMQVTGYRVNSATSIDIAILQFMDTSPIASGSYNYPPTSGTKTVIVSYAPAVNPNDTNENIYLLTSTTANISAFSSSNTQGTFSGNGMYYSNGTVVPTNTIAITGGTFNVPVIPLIALNVLQQPIDKKIEKIIKRIMSSR
ncbi:MAG TPA: hypothetical protein DCQ28_00385 [Bacteroidetes bacterium]|nr:hypothetical protein [Bacteroidota bacterium]